MAVDTSAMGLIVEPRSIIDVSVSMYQSTLAVGFVILKPSLVHGAIGPYLFTLSTSHIGAFQPINIKFE
jgi:hypothetical protein